MINQLPYHDEHCKLMEVMIMIKPHVKWAIAKQPVSWHYKSCTRSFMSSEITNKNNKTIAKYCGLAVKKMEPFLVLAWGPQS